MLREAVHLHVLAPELRVGDEIREEGFIARRVDRVDVQERLLSAGFVVVDYTIPGTGIPGSATYALCTELRVLRVDEGGH